MSNSSKPDVQALMQEITRAARNIEEEPKRARLFRPKRPFASMLSPELESLWDVWVQPPVVTHRGWRGVPVVWAKRAMLLAFRLHDRELLKKQREFNRHVKLELGRLHEQIRQLAEQLETSGTR